MRALAADAVRRVAARARRGEVVVVTAPTEACSLDGLLGAPIGGALTVWDPGQAGSTWSAVGRGEVARLEASGADRFEVIAARARTLFASVREARDGDCEEAPGPALFGGLAFRPESPADQPWTGFAAASFVLPRWLFLRRSDGSSFIRFAARAEELQAGERLFAEIARVLAALARPRGLRAAGASPRTSTRLEDLDPTRWTTVVHDALGRIRASELAKVVAARRSQVTLDRPIDVIEVLERLGKDQIGCVRFAFERAGSVFLGATPERLVELRGLDVTSEALAGSIARGGREDGPAGEALLASEKDRREHDLVVRGVRESLAPLCSDVRHPAEPSVCSLRNVLHLRTPVSASLAAPVHVLELVRALHPTPAVCGFPRAASAQWIRDHEPASRGWYASPVGWFDARGDGAFAVAIRSAVVTGAEAWLYAGAGIVDGSDPASEYRETAVKQLAMLWALGVEP